MSALPFEPTKAPAIAVVFLTRVCGEGFPADYGQPACLLPLGWQTLAEHVLDQLHLAGFTEIHLVTSDAASRLRRLLGEGDRWGLQLQWHVTDSGSHPYRILRLLDFRNTDHVLLGHADRFVSSSLLESLHRHRGVLCVNNKNTGNTWSGWSCLPVEVIRGLGSKAPWATICESMLALQNFFPDSWLNEGDDGNWLEVDEPATYLQSQRQWMHEGWLKHAPLSWIRHEWGLQHPGAKVEAADGWVGPVVVGPGCVVQSGSKLVGPVTLSRDVWLGRAAEVSDSVILEQSFISAGLSLDTCVVNGTRLWRNGVSVQLPDSDVILTQLSTGMPVTRLIERAFGQLVACGLLMLTWPLGLGVWLSLYVSQQLSCKPWTGKSLSDGSSISTQHFQLDWYMRKSGWLRDFLNLFCGWINVAMGRWAWWGIRERSQEEFDLLPDSWRPDLQRGRVGLWHLAATDGRPPVASSEQEAAADLFWLLQMRESCFRFGLYKLGVLLRSFVNFLSGLRG